MDYEPYKRELISTPESKTGLDTSHIYSNYEAYESARTGFFTFTLGDITGILKASYNGTENDDSPDVLAATANDYLRLNITKAAVPHFQLEQLKYTRGNEVVNFAGKPTWSAGSLVVDDIVGVDTKSILMAWQALAYNVHTGKGGRMQNYKRNGVLTEYTQDYEQIRSWDLYGCWVSNITEPEFDKTADGARQLTATIIFDRAIMRLSEEVDANATT